ncbi:MAG: hypothetical protein ACXWO1_12555 [Isosphaeraceae bacterium]
MMVGLQVCTSKQYKPGGDEASGFIAATEPAAGHCQDGQTSTSAME